MALHSGADDGTCDIPICYRLEPGWYRLFAIERAGELLTEIDGKGRNQYTQEDSEGDHATRREAGFSEHQ